MARFCIATKMAPSEYRTLTLLEFGAFMDALQERNGSDDLEELI